MHTVWKAHPDRLLRALPSPEKALRPLLQWLYNKTLAPFCGVGEWRAAETIPDPGRLISIDSEPGLSLLEQLWHLRHVQRGSPAPSQSYALRSYEISALT